MYAVQVKASAQRSLDGLDRSIQRRIVAKMALLVEDARPPQSKKLVGEPNLWRIRVGDYRIVYSIDEEKESIEITIIAHRRESYRGL